MRSNKRQNMPFRRENCRPLMTQTKCLLVWNGFMQTSLKPGQIKRLRRWQRPDIRAILALTVLRPSIPKSKP
jgi:hypothetical protein